QSSSVVWAAPVSGAIVAAAAVAAVWLFRRWQEERNKPINRLRRGALEVSHRIGERLPEPDDLPEGTAPISGAVVALLSTAVVVRALRGQQRDQPVASLPTESDLRKLGARAAKELSPKARRAAKELSPKAQRAMNELSPQVRHAMDELSPHVRRAAKELPKQRQRGRRLGARGIAALAATSY